MYINFLGDIVMKLLRLLLVVTFAVLVSGCYSSPIVKDDTLLAESEGNFGYLAVGSERVWTETSRTDTPTLQLLMRSSAGLSQGIITVTFVKNSDFVFQKLPVGEYVIPTSYLGFSHMQFPTPGTKFLITPRKITYIGDFNASVRWPKIGLLTKRNLKVVNNQERALERLRSTYPTIANTYPVEAQVKVFEISD
jgi:hypothetical protein